MKLTQKEESIIAVARLNEAVGRREVIRHWQLGRLRITYNRRSSENLWGRFGGGWNWNVGVMIGGATAIVNVLVFSLRFTIAPKTPLNQRNGQ